MVAHAHAHAHAQEQEQEQEQTTKLTTTTTSSHQVVHTHSLNQLDSTQPFNPTDKFRACSCPSVRVGVAL